jgi:hypothetical protein
VYKDTPSLRLGSHTSMKTTLKQITGESDWSSLYRWYRYVLFVVDLANLIKTNKMCEKFEFVGRLVSFVFDIIPQLFCKCVRNVPVCKYPVGFRHPTALLT